MSAATPRIASNAPDQRMLFAALGAIILAIALVVAFAISRPATVKTPSAPAVTAPALSDHGWSATDTGSSTLIIRGTNGGGLEYRGIPQPAAGSTPTNVVVTDTASGGLQVRYGVAAASAPTKVLVTDTASGGLQVRYLPDVVPPSVVGWQTPSGSQLPFSDSSSTHGGRGTRIAR